MPCKLFVFSSDPEKIAAFPLDDLEVNYLCMHNRSEARAKMSTRERHKTYSSGTAEQLKKLSDCS